jgi:hypothetical protein
MHMENRLPSDTWIDCSKILDDNANWLKLKQHYILEIARIEFALISTHLRKIHALWETIKGTAGSSGHLMQISTRPEGKKGSIM